jgi:hypothetical protein
LKSKPNRYRLQRNFGLGASGGVVQLSADLKKDELANAPAFKSLKDIEAEKRAAERPVRPSTGGGQPR